MQASAGARLTPVAPASVESSSVAFPRNPELLSPPCITGERSQGPREWEADSLYREGWIATAPRQGRAGTRGHSRAPQSTRESASARRTTCKWQQTRAASDPFINHETVRRCTRFVPGSRPPPLPRQKKALQASLKPTPGLEPGTPSLRGKSSLAQKPGIHGGSALIC